MGFLSELFEGAVEGVSSLVETAVECYKEFAPVIEKVIPIIAILSPAIALKVVTALASVARVLGVLDKTVNPKELGDKILQSTEAGYSRDDFDNDDSYSEFLDSYEIDQEKSSHTTDFDKVIASGGYIAMMMESALNNRGLSVTDVIHLVTSDPDHFTGERLQEMLDAGLIKKAKKYYSGECSLDMIDVIETDLIKLERKLNPSLAFEEARERVQAYVEA